MSPLLCYNCSWSKSNSTYTKLGEYSTEEDVGATPTGNTFTITGLTTGSVYWLQITVADADSSNVNTISLSGFTEVEGSSILTPRTYWSTLSGFYKVTGDPTITTTGTAGSSVNQERLTSILIKEANIS